MTNKVNKYLLAALRRNSAASELVTRLRTLSTKSRLACNPTCKPTFRRAKDLAASCCGTAATSFAGLAAASAIVFACNSLLYNDRTIAVPCLNNRVPIARNDILDGPKRVFHTAHPTGYVINCRSLEILFFFKFA